MSEQERRLLVAVQAKLERSMEQLRGVKSSDANIQAWGKVLDVRCEIATTLGMLTAALRE